MLPANTARATGSDFPLACERERERETDQAGALFPVSKLPACSKGCFDG